MKCLPVSSAPNTELEIAAARLVDGGEMAGDGARRGQAVGAAAIRRRRLGAAGVRQFERGPHGTLGIGGAAAERLVDQAQLAVGRVLGHGGVGRGQAEAGDGAEEAHILALDDHELPLAQLLHRLPAPQVDGHALLGVGGGDLPQQDPRILAAGPIARRAGSIPRACCVHKAPLTILFR